MAYTEASRGVKPEYRLRDLKQIEHAEQFDLSSLSDGQPQSVGTRYCLTLVDYGPVCGRTGR